MFLVDPKILQPSGYTSNKEGYFSISKADTQQNIFQTCSDCTKQQFGSSFCIFICFKWKVDVMDSCYIIIFCHHVLLDNETNEKNGALCSLGNNNYPYLLQDFLFTMKSKTLLNTFPKFFYIIVKVKPRHAFPTFSYIKPASVLVISAWWCIRGFICTISKLAYFYHVLFQCYVSCFYVLYCSLWLPGNPLHHVR